MHLKFTKNKVYHKHCDTENLRLNITSWIKLFVAKAIVKIKNIFLLSEDILKIILHKKENILIFLLSVLKRSKMYISRI